MREPEHIALPLTIERMGLFIRYTIYALVVTLIGFGTIKSNPHDIAIISGILFVHQLFVHAVFWTRRYGVFFTRFNFLINFAEITLVVGLTGSDTSAGYLLYYFFIIGFIAYDRRYRRVLLTALLSAMSYTLTVLIEAWRVGLEEQVSVLAIKVICLIFVGWLMAVIADRLRKTEETAYLQAARLASSEATLRTILNSAGDPIVVFDDSEFITEANARASEFLSLPHEKLIGQRFRAFIFDDGTLAPKFANLRVRGEGQSEEVFVNAEGEEHTVEMVVRSFIREHTRFYVAIIRDISSRKNLQEATRLANVQLERLNSELRQVDQLKTGFLTSISRDMRSPLSAVAGYVEMLLEEELGEINPDQRRALQTCRRGLLRVFRLIDEALDLRRLESKRNQFAVLTEDDGVESHPKGKP